jgi:hypothetical protein
VRALPCTVALAAAAALIGAPAQAADPPRADPQRTYFSCAGTAKAQNAEAGLPSWDTSAPATALQGGGGCGRVDTPASQARGVSWQGTFRGNLDTAAVELYDTAWAGPARATGPLRLDYTLTVDGRAPISGTAETTPAAGPNGAVSKVTFRITGIALLSEPGAGTIQRTVKLTLNGQSTVSTWTWDASDTPAGITFNG